MYRFLKKDYQTHYGLLMWVGEWKIRSEMEIDQVLKGEDSENT